MTNRRFECKFLVPAIAILAMLLPSLVFQSGARADGPKRVGIVIEADGSVETHCVPFDGDNIKGMDALGMVAEVQKGRSGEICKINSTGCPRDDCWCECSVPNEECVYWSYWHLKDGVFKFSNVGAAYVLRNGDVDGWKWGKQPQYGGSPPPARSFDDICPRLPDTPTPTATDSPTPPPAATDTPEPEPTAPPTQAPTPTDVPRPEVRFSISAERLTEGACATLQWDVSNAKAVYLDGSGVTGSENRQVCPPPGATRYELRVVALDGDEMRREVSLEVDAQLVQMQQAPAPEENAQAPAAVVAAKPQSDSPAMSSQPVTETRNDSNPPAVENSATASTPALPAAEPQAAEQADVSAVATAAPLPALQGLGEVAGQRLQPGPTQANPGEQRPAAPRSGGLLTSKTAWFMVLASAALGVVGLGGVAFVGLMVALGLVYWRYTRRSMDDDVED
jgi:hypothetical protein